MKAVEFVAWSEGSGSQGSGLRVQIQGSKFRGLGFRVQGLGDMHDPNSGP